MRVPPSEDWAAALSHPLVFAPVLQPQKFSVAVVVALALVSPPKE